MHLSGQCAATALQTHDVRGYRNPLDAYVAVQVCRADLSVGCGCRIVLVSPSKILHCAEVEPGGVESRHLRSRQRRRACKAAHSPAVTLLDASYTFCTALLYWLGKSRKSVNNH